MPFVVRCHGLGQDELSLNGLRQALGKEHHSAFVALGLVHVKAALSKVDIFDAEVQWFADSKPATVKKVHDESSWVMLNIRNAGHELSDVGLSGALDDGVGPFGAEGVDWPEFSLEHITVEK